MASQGFDPKDFLYFLDSDKVEKVRYIRDELHPRLREFGRDLAAGLDRRLGVTLRPQLRSGRWYKNPWGTWVSLVYPDEPRRSDNRRPRLSVFLDEDECIVGYQQNVWRPRWKRLVEKHRKPLERVMRRASAEGLELGLCHWADHERTTTLYKTPAELLDAAKQWGQDFVVVGRVYPFPQEVDRLTSPKFADEALDVMAQAFPVYKRAFEATES